MPSFNETLSDLQTIINSVTEGFNAFKTVELPASHDGLNSLKVANEKLNGTLSQIEANTVITVKTCFSTRVVDAYR